MTVAIVDTSIFCELIPVASRSSDSVNCRKLLKQKIGAGEHLVLPMATIVETGNHIGQEPDGRVRRRAAERFVEQVRKAIDGTSPFAATQFVAPDTLHRWLGEFPDWAGRGSGLGDLSILKEWERLCEIHPSRRVYIWTKDQHLDS